MEQIHLVISGEVQGVGFRAWAVDNARELGITGWVRNREDETVEIVAEGEEKALHTLITRCRKGPEIAWVEDVAVGLGKYTGEFKSFKII